MEIKMPDRIQVGGHEYFIEWDNIHQLAADELGDVSHRQRRIRLYEHQTPSELTNTIIHELLHAIDNVYLETALTEAQVRVIANGFHQVLQNVGIKFVR